MDIIEGLIERCSQQKDLKATRELQLLTVISGLESVSYFGDHLIRAFRRCSCLSEAYRTFLKIFNPTVYTWNGIISTYAEAYKGKEAHSLYVCMQQQGIKADRVTVLCMLSLCGREGSLLRGKLLHMTIFEHGLDSDVFIGSTLVHMYSKCGSLEEASKVFRGLQNPNVVSWSALIAGYAESGYGREAFELFEDMLSHGLQPQKPTYLCALKACAICGKAMQGYWVHDLIIRNELQIDLVLASSLIDMYGKCGRLAESSIIFWNLSERDAVSWAALISGHAEQGDMVSTFELLEDMKEDSILPDEVTFLNILRSCSRLSLRSGRLVHDSILRAGFESNMAIANSLVDMYAKSSSLSEACKLFNNLKWNIISCSALISGCVQEGEGILAFSIFSKMIDDDIEPDKVTLLALLKACSMMGTIYVGRTLQQKVIEIGLHNDVSLCNAFVDMYAKCGSLVDAQKAFDMSVRHDMVSWHAIMSGYAHHGKYQHARAVLDEMRIQGVKPDQIAYMNVLLCCSYVGLIDSGSIYFMSIRDEHAMSPTVQHFNCMVDLLGRVGHLMEAEDLLQTLPNLPNLIGWSTLLSGCKIFGNKELGTRCFTELSKLDFREASSYVILSNIFSNDQMLDNGAKCYDRCSIFG